MTFEVFPPTGKARAAQTRRRMLNGIPGFISWLILLLLLFSSRLMPWMIFNLGVTVTIYAAFSMVIAAAAALIGYRRIHKWEQTDWSNPLNPPVRHLVIIPNYREPLNVLRTTLRRLAESQIASKQVIVVLAMEESDDQARSTAAQLQAEFAACFQRLITTIHPKGLPNEVRGKSANLAWAARRSTEELSSAGYDLAQCVITVADADSLLHPRYLECVTYQFVTSSRREETIWQAPIFYHNNLEAVSPLFEPMHSYSSALQLAFLGQGLAFSTYSMSARLAAKLGWWDVNVIAEDQHMFIKGYIRQRGNLMLDPIYLPVSACVVTGHGFWNTCLNRYQQTVRHAWGAEEVGYAFDQVLFEAKMPPLRAVQLLARVLIDHVLAIAIPALTLILVPLLFLLQPEIAHQALTMPQLPLLLLSYLVMLVTSVVFWRIDVRLRPHPPKARAALVTALSFVLQPIMLLLLVALPALVAQTRLLLGTRPLAYQVAPK